MTFVDRLAREGHGAIQVGEGDPDTIKAVLIGPIRHWWTLLDDQFGVDPAHVEYLTWRDAVDAALVKSEFLVYRPYAAWRGSWHDDAQLTNNFAIAMSDVVIDLSPPGVPNEGTQHERKIAESYDKLLIDLPPGDEGDIARALVTIHRALKGTP